MLIRIIEFRRENSGPLLQVFLYHKCLIVRYVCDHDFSGAVSCKLLLHKFKSSICLRSFRKILGQLILYTYPASRYHREYTRNGIYQEKKISFINDKLTDFKHKTVSGFFITTHFCPLKNFFIMNTIQISTHLHRFVYYILYTSVCTLTTKAYALKKAHRDNAICLEFVDHFLQ